MGFIGSVPPEARAILVDLLSKVEKSRNIFVGCSGNFTIDRILSGLGYKVHSNDVSLYSKLIADIILNRNTELKCTDPTYESVFLKWPKDSKYRKLVEVMFVLKTSKFRPQKNDFQKEMWESYLEKGEEFYDRTLKKFEAGGVFDFKIESFYFGDFLKHVQNCNGVSFLFAPTYKGGYEKMYQIVEDVFEYEKATYNIFDSKTAEKTYLNLLESGESVIYSDIDFPELAEFKKGVVRYSNKRDISLYASLKSHKTYFFSPSPEKENPTLNIISNNFQFSENAKIEIAKVPSDQIFHYKHIFMSARVNYSDKEDFGIALHVDGQVFGFAGFKKFMSSMDHVFVSSDFVVKSGEKRLSKLLIMLLLSKEVKALLTRQYLHSYRGVKTSVYTPHPVSMKYRGIYELVERKKGKLVYRQEFTNAPLSEIFKTWFKTKRK
ncbi:hypothetical protein [Leptospira kmetyi]|uniref:SIR2-like domain-containing protein n=1 Tax=Leptospira kmetyi TaxID=408139 RepID=A0ABX4N5S1_9LEPT|nr:hypothetical protein [Leptospira kmetyi]PJZ28738.1 hypothetical protein CH378_16185 [Leptospira kmetyi]PJZ39556.1 hypothetical protein CH370_21130 [Leptospira kmetyi]